MISQVIKTYNLVVYKLFFFKPLYLPICSMYDTFTYMDGLDLW